MVMPQVAFDTLKFAEELEESGLDPKIAAAQAKAQVKILSDLVDRQLATKDDISRVEDKIEDQIRGVKDEIREVKDEIKSEVKGLEHRMNGFDIKLDLLEQRLTMKLGRWMIASVGFLAALFTVFHFL